MKLNVTINGTDTNHWHKLGLIRNPFPQIPQAELVPYMDSLAKLDSDPIMDTSQIRQILRGWSDEFIELCCKMFKQGERVRFSVSFPDQVK